MSKRIFHNRGQVIARASRNGSQEAEPDTLDWYENVIAFEQRKPSQKVCLARLCYIYHERVVLSQQQVAHAWPEWLTALSTEGSSFLATRFSGVIANTP